MDINFYQSANRPTVRYLSSSTVYEEALENGRWIGLYYSCTGQIQRENVTEYFPGVDTLALPAHTFELEIDGQSLHNRWEWQGASQRPGKREGTIEAVVELRHQLRPVSLKIITRLDGTAILSRQLEITNTSDRSAALNAISPWSGILWSTLVTSIWSPRIQTNASMLEVSKYRVGYFDADAPGEEGNFVWQTLGQETLRISRHLRGRSFGPPYFIVENQITGERALLALAWSNNFTADFSLLQGQHLAFRIAPAAAPPLRVIAPGETVLSPEIHLAISHGELSEAVSDWHEHIRRSVTPPRPADKKMYTIAGRVVEEAGDWILREIDQAVEMGVEAFMVDAGWYGDAFAAWPENRGDWHEGDWLPGGLAGIRNYCHQHGLLFGLWHEAESIAEKSRLRAEHPDWPLQTDAGRLLGNTLNLANPQVAKFYEDTILRLIGEHQLDFYKLDYNEDVREGGQSLQDGYAENEFWRHTEVLYRAYERVLREYPNIMLENCASGGGRNDIGMLAHFHYLAESDWSVHPCGIRAINAMTLFIPPESICYYHNHVNMGRIVQAHLTADADTHLRVTLFSLPIFVGFGAQNATLEGDFYARTRRYIELHKGFCRPVLANQPRVFHHTPYIGITSPAPWCVLEYCARDYSRGYAGVFKLAPGEDSYLLRLRGVKRNSDYNVSLDNSRQTFQISGVQLANGLLIELDSALTSELVLYQQL